MKMDENAAQSELSTVQVTAVAAKYGYVFSLVVSLSSTTGLGFHDNTVINIIHIANPP